MLEQKSMDNLNWNRKDLLGIEDLSKEEIIHILQTANSFKEISSRTIKKVPALRGKTIVLLFYEPSTRTRMSFELAAKRLSADVVNISVATSSTKKGETIIDTLKNIQAMNVDTVIIRHNCAGAPLMLSSKVNAGIINAGDGSHEHPTQALLDIYTILEHKKSLENLNISIIGDIMYSRVARSNIWGMTKLGANVTLCAPYTLLPKDIEKMRDKSSKGSIRVTNDIDSAVKDADVLMALRMQLERQDQALFSSAREYAMYFGLNNKRVEHAKKDVLIMHPGPINRGIEISDKLANDPRAVILNQVTNGIAVRMAVLYLSNSVNTEAKK